MNWVTEWMRNNNNNTFELRFSVPRQYSQLKIKVTLRQNQVIFLTVKFRKLALLIRSRFYSGRFSPVLRLSFNSEVISKREPAGPESV